MKTENIVDLIKKAQSFKIDFIRIGKVSKFSDLEGIIEKQIKYRSEVAIRYNSTFEKLNANAKFQKLTEKTAPANWSILDAEEAAHKKSGVDIPWRIKLK